MRKFGPKILQLLKEWTETFPSDFRDEKMVGHLEDIIHRIAACDEVQSAWRNTPHQHGKHFLLLEGWIPSLNHNIGTIRVPALSVH